MALESSTGKSSAISPCMRNWSIPLFSLILPSKRILFPPAFPGALWHMQAEKGLHALFLWSFCGLPLPSVSVSFLLESSVRPFHLQSWKKLLLCPPSSGLRGMLLFHSRNPAASLEGAEAPSLANLTRHSADQPGDSGDLRCLRQTCREGGLLPGGAHLLVHLTLGIADS